MTNVRGIRGAIQARSNTIEDILAATTLLLQAIIRENDIRIADIASVFFTATADLQAVYPARAAREMGWLTVPLLCAREMDVADSMTRVIRVLVHVNTALAPEQIKHQYLGDAVNLRPDLQ
jgi:chorismate mutase